MDQSDSKRTKTAQEKDKNDGGCLLIWTQPPAMESGSEKRPSLPLEVLAIVCKYFTSGKDLLSLSMMNNDYHNMLLKNIKSDPSNNVTYDLLCHFAVFKLSCKVYEYEPNYYEAFSGGRLPNGRQQGEERWYLFNEQQRKRFLAHPDQANNELCFLSHNSICLWIEKELGQVVEQKQGRRQWHIGIFRTINKTLSSVVTKEDVIGDLKYLTKYTNGILETRRVEGEAQRNGKKVQVIHEDGFQPFGDDESGLMVLHRRFARHSYDNQHVEEQEYWFPSGVRQSWSIIYRLFDPSQHTPAPNVGAVEMYMTEKWYASGLERFQKKVFNRCEKYLPHQIKEKIDEWTPEFWTSINFPYHQRQSQQHDDTFWTKSDSNKAEQTTSSDEQGHLSTEISESHHDTPPFSKKTWTQITTTKLPPQGEQSYEGKNWYENGRLACEVKRTGGKVVYRAHYDLLGKVTKSMGK